MSWFNELAGKAENLLNTLDSSAAQALTQDSLSRTSKNRNKTHIGADQQQFNPNEFQQFRGQDSSMTQVSPSRSSNASIISETNQENSKQFAFFASQQPHQTSSLSQSKKMSPSKSNLQTNNKMSANSSIFSASNGGGNTTHAHPIASSKAKHSDTENDQNDDGDNHDVENDKNIVEETPLPPKLDTKMLESAVVSLRQEVSELMQRNHALDEANRRLSGDCSRLTSQIGEREDRIAGLLSAQDDLFEQLHAKEATIRELKSKPENSSQSPNFSEMLSKNAQLRDELREKCSQIDEQHDELARLNSKLTQLEARCANQSEQSQRQSNTERKKRDQLQSKIDIETQKRLAVERESASYKEKAIRVLQEKERLIEQLRDNQSASTEKKTLSNTMQTETETEMESHQQMSSEMEHENENEQLREEVQRSRFELTRREKELAELEDQMQSETGALRHSMELLEKELEQERRIREDCEADLQQQSRELFQAQETVLRERSELQEKAMYAENEAKQLRAMLSKGGTSAATGKATTEERGEEGGRFSDMENDVEYRQAMEELEARVSKLSESLIQKQSELSRAVAENNSQRMRVERLEKEHAQLEQSYSTLLSSSSLTYSNSPNRFSGGASAQNSYYYHNNFSSSSSVINSDYIKINFQDDRLTRNWKTAVKALDSVGFRLGTFLRRYPLMRIFFIIYSLLLHLWVVFILFTYKPEMHSESSGKLPKH